jgi:hypothetical protein
MPSNKELYEAGCSSFVVQYVSALRRALPSEPVTVNATTDEAKEEAIRLYVDFINDVRDIAMSAITKETLEETQEYIKEEFEGKYFDKHITEDGYTVYGFSALGKEVDRIYGFGKPSAKKEGERKLFDMIFNPQLLNETDKYMKEWDEIIAGVSSRKNVERKESIKSIIKKAEYLSHLNREGGEDWRKGMDVDEKILFETFGFRAVEFGNWVTQKERQSVINHAYDAFKDLAYVLGIEDKSIGIGGKLAIAFGSRGKSNAKAHYEPDRMVINLTKTKGDGSFAHEWFHAVDNISNAERCNVPVIATLTSAAYDWNEDEANDRDHAFSKTIINTRNMLIFSE